MSEAAGLQRAQLIATRRGGLRPELRRAARRRDWMPADRSRCWPGCTPAASSCSRSERIRSIRDLKGKSVGIQALGFEPAPVPGRHGHLRRARPAAGHRVGRPAHRSNAMELFAEGKIDAFLGFPPEPQELRAREHRPRDRQQRRRSALVAVLLLHALGNRDFVASIRSRPSVCCARSSRPPTSAQPSPSRSRGVWSMAGSRSQLRLRAPDDEGAAVRNCGTSTIRRTRCASTRSACTRPA